MLEICRQTQLSLNIKKCIFATLIGILFGHVVCKEGKRVDLVKINIILDLKPPVNPKQVLIFLGHIGHYRKFIRHYLDITYPMEELLKSNVPFIWNKECSDAFKMHKWKLIEAPILRFMNWLIKFYVHIDALAIVIDAILTQPSEDNMDHSITYIGRKLSKEENNYSTTEREELGIIFALQKL